MSPFSMATAPGLSEIDDRACALSRQTLTRRSWFRGEEIRCGRLGRRSHIDDVKHLRLPDERGEIHDQPEVTGPTLGIICWRSQS